MPRQRHVAKVAQSATATWQEHATSAFWWGQGPFSNKIFFAGIYFNFFFTGTKIKTGPNYRDDYHI